MFRKELDRLCAHNRGSGRFDHCYWPLDFVLYQFARGRRLNGSLLNAVDDVTRECLAAIPDTWSISHLLRQLAEELDQRHD